MSIYVLWSSHFTYFSASRGDKKRPSDTPQRWESRLFCDQTHVLHHGFEWCGTDVVVMKRLELTLGTVWDVRYLMTLCHCFQYISRFDCLVRMIWRFLGGTVWMCLLGSFIVLYKHHKKRINEVCVLPPDPNYAETTTLGASRSKRKLPALITFREFPVAINMCVNGNQRAEVCNCDGFRCFKSFQFLREKCKQALCSLRSRFQNQM